MANPRKPFYRLVDICARWKMSESDIAAYVLAGELVIATVVAGLHLEYGTLDERTPGHWEQVPLGTRNHTGPIDLLPPDGWLAIENGERKVSQFHADPKRYVAIQTEGGGDAELVIRRGALVFNHTEILRFEAVNDITPAPAVMPDPGFTRRGPHPRFDWDVFWVEVCHTVFVDGLPRSQGALVRQMDQWFAARAETPPATSTVKKKLIPLWRRINPDALASAP